MQLLWPLHSGHHPPEISHTDQDVGKGQETTDFQASMLEGTTLNTKSRKAILHMHRWPPGDQTGKAQSRDWHAGCSPLCGQPSQGTLLNITLISPHGQW